MTRMSREFSLVLLGSGILTAGYFLASDSEKDLQAKEEQQAQQQLSGHSGSGHFYRNVLIYHYLSGGSMRSPASAAGVSRGGFGSIGRFSAGS